jgi:hypothetical protein
VKLNDDLYRVTFQSKSEWAIRKLTIAGITRFSDSNGETTTYHLADPEGGSMMWRQGDNGIRVFPTYATAVAFVSHVRAMPTPEAGQLVGMGGKNWRVRTVHSEKGEIEALTLYNGDRATLVAYSTFLTEVEF